MKKIIYWALVPATLLAITSCQEEPDTRRVVSIEFVEAGFGNTPYEKLAEAFMELHPEVRVSLVPNKSMASTTEVRISNGTASDIMIYNRTVNDIRLWSVLGLVEDLSDLFAEECENGQTLLDKLDDNAKKISYYKGQYLTIPELYYINGFVYNASLFETYNWAIPHTTKEFATLCETINNTTLQGGKKIKPLVYCKSADGYLYYADEGWTVNYEGIAQMDTFYQFASAEVYHPDRNVGKLEALKRQKKYFFDSNYHLEGSSSLDNIQAQSKLLTFDAAMMLNGSWFENEVSKYVTEFSPEFKMFALPEMSDEANQVLRSDTYIGEKERVIHATIETNMFIPSKAKNKADAKEFLRFIATSEACQIWTKYSNSIRPLKYDYTSSNPYYAEMSTFGKSVLDIANSYTIYTPNSAVDIAVVNNQCSFRPNGYWFWKFNENTPEQCVDADYQFAKSQWNNWLALANDTFQ